MFTNFHNTIISNRVIHSEERYKYIGTFSLILVFIVSNKFLSFSTQFRINNQFQAVEIFAGTFPAKISINNSEANLIVCTLLGAH